MVDLWVESYRPQTLDEYVWRDAGQRAQVTEWLASGALPHLLFSGTAGTGKSSLAKLLFKELKVQPGDILEINASRERNVDVVQDKIVNFVSTWPIGDMKYVLLDEADSMSPLAQRILRGEMEKYHSTVRFVLTINYHAKIIPAIHSRCQGFQFHALDHDQFILRVIEILTAEKITFDDDIMMTMVDQNYPDLRKCINVLQQNCCGGRLKAPLVEEVATKDYLFEMATLFRSGRILDGRKLIVAQAQPEEYDDIYRFLYRNLDLWGDNQDEQDEAILIIKRGLIDNAIIADQEINLAATLITLSGIRKKG